MNYNRLGLSELSVSQICLGTMTFGNPVEKKEAIEMVHWSMDNGINFFDTADIYEGYDRHSESPGGVSEKILGEAFMGQRDKVIITTKVGNSIGGDYVGSGLGRKHIEHQVHKSLEQLKTDYIDVYQMHKPDTNTPFEESIEVFVELKKQGKIRYWGVSNFDAYQLTDVLEICKVNSWESPIVSQLPYSWLNRQLEDELIQLLESSKIALTPYRILEGGLLTGKYNKGTKQEEGCRLKEHPNWVSPIDDKTYEALEKYKLEATENGLELSQYAAKWLLDKENIPSVLIGSKNTRQIAPFLSL